MRRAPLIFAGMVAIILALAAPAPANAGYGAIAYDQQSGKEGASWDQKTPAEANELALKECGSAECRVHPVEPKGCGALAISKEDKAWGGADRETLDEAKHFLLGTTAVEHQRRPWRTAIPAPNPTP